MYRVKTGTDIIMAEGGELLSELLASAHLPVEMPCGGRGVCGKCRVLVNGKEELACRYVIGSDIEVVLPDRGEIVSETGISFESAAGKNAGESVGKNAGESVGKNAGESVGKNAGESVGESVGKNAGENAGESVGKNAGENVGGNAGESVGDELSFALDIGTTTLALALVSSKDSSVKGVYTSGNPQRAFGADIMTRIEYCRRNSGAKLTSAVVDGINRLVKKSGVSSVGTMYVAGNVTMLHLLFSEDCSSIGVAPYTPVFLESREYPAEALGIEGVRRVVSLPSVSSFVGADIVAGMNYTGLPAPGNYSLLVDLGTNAEIVLFSDSSAVASAAAAGPCFEGANISSGMSATRGAVRAFYIDENGVRRAETIENAPAAGICGTGLVDIVAELLRTGEIDETGYMECSEYEVADGVTLTQDDVRQFQLAKSAVFSAMISLMKNENVSFDDIGHLYISGGFSAGINPRSAVRCGLLPAELAEKITVLNNSSLLGTVKFASEKNDLSVYIRNTRYIDLSSDAFFSGLFIENMMFDS